MVEFTIVAPIFLAVLIVGLDLLRFSYMSLTTQFVATRVIRSAAVGPSVRPPQYPDQASWIQGEIIRYAGMFGVGLTGDDIAVCGFATIAAGNDCDPALDDGGQPNELIAVQIAALVEFLLGPDARFFCGSVVFCDGGTDAATRADDVPPPWHPV